MTTTLAAWRADMQNGIAVALAQAARLDTRIASLEARGAGPAHLDMVRERYAGLVEVAQLGEQILQAGEDVHVPVGEAIARAGGSAYIAEDKQFATTD